MSKMSEMDIYVSEVDGLMEDFGATESEAIEAAVELWDLTNADKCNIIQALHQRGKGHVSGS